jgi:hypothetical protein
VRRCSAESSREWRRAGEGGKGMAIPHWKDPITHQSWRKGDRYIRTRRLNMEDPLIHHCGESTMSLVGLNKVT